MPARKAPAPPPSPEARAEVLNQIRQSSEPLTAKSLVKSLVAPHQIAEKQLVPILDDYVAAGLLQRYAPKTAKGPPRYWDRDLTALNRAAVRDEVQRATAPLTAAEIAKLLGKSLKLTAVEMSAILTELLAAGAVHELPPASVKGKPRFWNHDVLDYGRIEVNKLLATKGPQPQTALRKGVKWLNDGQFEQLFSRMIETHDLWPHPSIGKVKPPLFGNRPPTPEPYLREVGTLLKNVVQKLMSVHVPPDDLRRALVQLIEESGITFGSIPAAPLDPNAKTLKSEPTPIDLINLMKQIEPGAERGALISARDLRRAAGLEKSQFDTTVLELARLGQLSLHRHDYATSLSPAERDDLVTDGAGTYYVGMALRQIVR